MGQSVLSGWGSVPRRKGSHWRAAQQEVVEGMWRKVQDCVCWRGETHAAVQIEVSFSGVAFCFDPWAGLDERHPASLTQRRGKGGDVGGRPSVLYLTIFLNLIQHKLTPALLTENFLSTCSIPPLLPHLSSTVCPFRFSNDGFNHSFVSLSPLPGLSVLFCIQNVNFDPPTNLSDGGRLCGLMQKHPSSHQTLRVWSQSSYIIKVLGSKMLCL